MVTFKVGDLIESVEQLSRFGIGDKFKVLETKIENGIQLVFIDKVNNYYYSHRFKLAEKKQPSKFRLMPNQFRIETAPPVKFTPKERKEIKELYKFRKKIAEVYKFSPKSAEKLQAIRQTLKLKQVTSRYLTLVHKKSQARIEYSTEDRSIAFHQCRQHIKRQREENRFMESDTTPTGLARSLYIHTLPNQIVNLYLSTILTKAKVPQTADNHIGIEIECGLPNGWDKSKLMPYSKKISLISDGSIQALPPGYVPQEVRLLTTEKEYEHDIMALTATLAELKAVVNKSCGLHVHLDMRNTDREIVKQRFANLVKSQKYLQGIVPEDRRANTYCKPARTLDPFNQPERYYAINGRAYAKYQTLEIRLHHGTLDGTEINNWVTLLLGIIKADPIKRASPTVKSFLEKIKAQEKIAKYVEETIAKNKPVIFEDNEGQCDLSHGQEICNLCNTAWVDGHNGHSCNNSRRRGIFPSCIRSEANV